jgi:hypothetical protein
MNPEQAERIASALEQIARNTGHTASAVDALANQEDRDGTTLKQVQDAATRVANKSRIGSSATTTAS